MAARRKQKKAPQQIRRRNVVLETQRKMFRIVSRLSLGQEIVPVKEIDGWRNQKRRHYMEISQDYAGKRYTFTLVTIEPTSEQWKKGHRTKYYFKGRGSGAIRISLRDFRTLNELRNKLILH